MIGNLLTDPCLGNPSLVAMSRAIRARLYGAIGALCPDWHDDDTKKKRSKVAMTASTSDEYFFNSYHTTKKKQKKKNLEKRFKVPADPLKIVLVRDIWLTGFDATCMAMMDVDKPMKGANLVVWWSITSASPPSARKHWQPISAPQGIEGTPGR